MFFKSGKFEIIPCWEKLRNISMEIFKYFLRFCICFRIHAPSIQRGPVLNQIGHQSMPLEPLPK